MTRRGGGAAEVRRQEAERRWWRNGGWTWRLVKGGAVARRRGGEEEDESDSAWGWNDDPQFGVSIVSALFCQRPRFVQVTGDRGRYWEIKSHRCCVE